ncbi:MAG: phosphoenolpyruvate--protein phosphotransferase [Proteobacteria bacterium]|nr:phosphoenolpyruvate--protein phosphotransferase [Pseudomonadota bacterium]
MSGAPASIVQLAAPLTGWCSPLVEVPDEAFASQLVGEGVAIDPLAGELLAPCDATVLAVAAARHAITLRGPLGCELLLHIGMDTVELKGEGFELHTHAGAQVRQGQRLLSFDLDLLARRARSLMTPFVIPAGSPFSVTRAVTGRAVRAGEFVLEVQTAAAALSSPAAAAGDTGRTEERRVRLAWPQGLHARPAAKVVARARGYAAQVSVHTPTREASARSAVALMALGARAGDELRVRATGADALAAVEAVSLLLAAAEPGAGGVPGARGAPAQSAGATAATMIVTPAGVAPLGQAAPAPPAEPGVLRGITASPGLASGVAFLQRDVSAPIEKQGQGVDLEAAALERARAQLRGQLAARAAQTAAPEALREIAAAHLQILDDPQLVDAATGLLSQGSSAAFAWKSALAPAAAALRALEDPRLRERAADLDDLVAQVAALLHPGATACAAAPPRHAIVLAREVLPSQMSALQAAGVAGVCMAEGGATSHVSILCAAMGIPALVALGPALLSVAPDTALVLDADAGLLETAPSQPRLTAVRGEITRQRACRERLRAQAQRACHTADGVRIEVFANIGSVAEARAAVDNGAEGCGLLRTEFLFLERQSAPSTDEQVASYRQIAAVLGQRPLTIRTLDAGGDKPIAYLPLPPEENPALGLRGIRTSLEFPQLLHDQLAAILILQAQFPVRVLLPMITDVQELREVRAAISRLQRARGDTRPVSVGAMIETPAAAVLAPRLAAEADFLSVGTNDLTQYVLAMDRGNPRLAARLDGLHPAVLELIARSAQAAREAGRHAAVCGGLASEVHAAPLLVGLGVNELSAVPSRIPAIKHLLGLLTLAQCQELAAAALQMADAAQVRALLARRLPQGGEDS